MGDKQATYDNHVEVEARISEWNDEAEALSSLDTFVTEAQDIGKYEWDKPDGLQGTDKTPTDT
jgi:hypothetical protein